MYKYWIIVVCIIFLNAMKMYSVGLYLFGSDCIFNCILEEKSTHIITGKNYIITVITN